MIFESFIIWTFEVLGHEKINYFKKLISLCDFVDCKSVGPNFLIHASRNHAFPVSIYFGLYLREIWYLCP